MHGIERTRKISGPLAQDQGISRVTIRYSDGRVLSIIPDAGREIFNEDDILELDKVFTHASAAAEWAHVGDITSEG